MEISLLLLAIILAFTLHFGVQKLFIYLKRFDDINHRSSHETIATRTGGIGIFLTLLLISLYHYFDGIELFDYSLFVPLGIMFIVGAYDDLYSADFKLKFVLQIIVAKILIDQGYVISNYYGLFGLYEIPWLLAQLSTVFVFLVVVNAINFIDGIDGLAITEVTKIIFLIELFSSQSTPLFTLGLLVIGSLLPLYYFNFKKQGKIFLGDGGSLLLGTLVMVYILYLLGPNYRITPSYEINKVAFSVLVLLYPLIDLLRVFIIRIRTGNSPFIADNNHFHHKLNKKLKGQHLTTLIYIQIITLIVFLVLFTITR